MANTKQKRWHAIAKRNFGWPVRKICSSEQISIRTFYRWLERYKKYGFEGLENKSTHPNRINYQISKKVINKIIQIRKQRDLNEYAIEAILKQDGVKVSHTTIYKILKKEGLINPLKKERKQRTYIRFERKHPNSLWQTDITHWKKKYVVAFIDDHSRFLVGCGVFLQAIIPNVLSVFSQAIYEYGTPEQVLTDHGTQFYNVHGGASQFDLFCGKYGIKHILAGIGKPTTNGKIERWFGTFKKKVPDLDAVNRFIYEYNFKRPHRSLKYRTPAELFCK